MTVHFGENYYLGAEKESQAILNEVVSQAGREVTEPEAA
jgi:hypothetical protein